MEYDKVTRDALRRMRTGEKRIFFLPDASAIDSGKSVAYQAQRILGCRFTAEANYKRNWLLITKMPAVTETVTVGEEKEAEEA